MSGGWTPVFNSALDGTLYGRWPHTGVWLCLLSQCDRYGRIDMVPRLLAAKIGCAEDVLLACIKDFQQPDPGSRTGDLDGRRLELLDPSRGWGWRVINHGLYRERARKAAYDAARTESGEDADRKRKEREVQEKRENKLSRDLPTRPDAPRDVPLSDADASPNADTTQMHSESDAHARNGHGNPLSKVDTHNRWMRVRNRFPRQTLTKLEWAEVKATAIKLVDDCLTTWDALLTSARDHVARAQRLGKPPLGIADFFSPQYNYWNRDWNAEVPATPLPTQQPSTL